MTIKAKIIIFIVAVIVLVSCFLLQHLIFDNKIEQLTAIRDMKQTVVQDYASDVYQTDTQSVADKQLLTSVFEKAFTFYNMDDFEAARAFAVSCNLPADFIECFYDTAELSDIYAQSMLDIICKYDSSDIYLLDRADGVAYYYAVVTLDTVKYTNGTFKLAFFIALRDDLTDRFASFVYYDVE